VDEAEKLSKSLMGQPKLLMPYQPFCDLRLHFAGHDQATEYRRELHLDCATAETSYKVGSSSFRREVFVSYPDQILVVRITASQPDQLIFSVRMDSPQPGAHVESAADGTLQMTGQFQPRQNPASSWTGSWDQPGMEFAAVLRVFASSGSVHNANDRLEISGVRTYRPPSSSEVTTYQVRLFLGNTRLWSPADSRTFLVMSVGQNWNIRRH
jgi:alpha-L-fucosidase 2